MGVRLRWGLGSDEGYVMIMGRFKEGSGLRMGYSLDLVMVSVWLGYDQGQVTIR